MRELFSKRKQIRLKDYDYFQNGCYFVTICTHEKLQILSDICRGGVLLRPLGKSIENEIKELEMYRAEQSPAPTEIWK